MTDNTPATYQWQFGKCTGDASHPRIDILTHGGTFAGRIGYRITPGYYGWELIYYIRDFDTILRQALVEAYQQWPDGL